MLKKFGIYLSWNNLRYFRIYNMGEDPAVGVFHYNASDKLGLFH